jgi:hypothetical protein
MKNALLFSFSLIPSILGLYFAAWVANDFKTANVRLAELETRADGNFELCQNSQSALQDKLEMKIQELNNELFAVQVILGINPKE